jgi:drug/metabolite transporter (DMT)-like permease
MPVRRQLAGATLVAASAVAFSSAGYFTRLISVDVWTMLFWRGVFAFGFVLLLAAARNGRRTADAFRSLGRAGVLAVVFSSCGMICYLAALRLTSVADVAVVYGSVPFVTAGLAWFAIRERTSRSTLMLSLVALAGVGVTFASAGGSHDLSGDALALAMTCLVALMVIALRRSHAGDALPVACLSSLLTAVAVLPLASPLRVSRDDLAELALFGCAQLGVGLALLAAGARLVPSSHAALISLLDLPLAPLWVWIAFGETPSSAAFVGGALVIAAVIAHIRLAQRDAARGRDTTLSLEHGGDVAADEGEQTVAIELAEAARRSA